MAVRGPRRDIFVLGTLVRSHGTHTCHVAKDHTPYVTMLNLGIGSLGITRRWYNFVTSNHQAYILIDYLKHRHVYRQLHLLRMFFSYVSISSSVIHVDHILWEIQYSCMLNNGRHQCNKCRLDERKVPLNCGFFLIHMTSNRTNMYILELYVFLCMWICIFPVFVLKTWSSVTINSMWGTFINRVYFQDNFPKNAKMWIENHYTFLFFLNGVYFRHHKNTLYCIWMLLHVYIYFSLLTIHSNFNQNFLKLLSKFFKCKYLQFLLKTKVHTLYIYSFSGNIRICTFIVSVQEILCIICMNIGRIL